MSEEGETGETQALVATDREMPAMGGKIDKLKEMQEKVKAKDDIGIFDVSH